MSDFNGLGPWDCFENYIHQDIEKALAELIPLFLDYANKKSRGMGLTFSRKENPALTWDSIYIDKFPPNWSYQNKLKNKDMYHHPHFTICIEGNRLWLQLVIPNQAYKEYWKRITKILLPGSKEFSKILEASKEIPELWLVLLHRHGGALGSYGVVDDGRIEFKFGNINNQTVFENKAFKPIHKWLEALNQVITEKLREDNPNIEFSFRALYDINPGSESSLYRKEMEKRRSGPRRNINPNDSLFFQEIKQALNALWPLYKEILEIDK